MAYIQNPKHDPDEDDEGHPVGVEVRDPVTSCDHQ
jgi:hypothetical protein